jgi:hypothetical protein
MCVLSRQAAMLLVLCLQEQPAPALPPSRDCNWHPSSCHTWAGPQQHQKRSQLHVWVGQQWQQLAMPAAAGAAAAAWMLLLCLRCELHALWMQWHL